MAEQDGFLEYGVLVPDIPFPDKIPTLRGTRDGYIQDVGVDPLSGAFGPLRAP